MDAFSLILQHVRDSMERQDIQGGVLIGFSGGADSTALLLALHALSKEKSIQIAALYVHHGLRDEAEQEAVFCRQTCEALGVPFYLRRVVVSRTGSTEAAAREARYAAFREMMRDAGLSTLALAHHMDDQAETMLMHLMYGAGVDGLGGMQEYRAPVWRPLLRCRREELREALRQLHQPWVEDSSNADSAYRRNAIRSRLIPEISALYPEAVPAMARSAEILREESACLRDLCAAWLARFGARGRWPFVLAEPLKAEHVALQRRILRMYSENLGLSLEFSQTEELRSLADAPPGTRCNLPNGWHALRTQQRIHWISAIEAHPVQWEPACIVRQYGKTGSGDGIHTQAVPHGLLEAAELRTRRPGDRIRPFGMQGSMKLKDYMISRRIDQPFRRDWPLLCRGSDVLWVIGVGASELLRVSAQSNDTVLISFSGDLPDALQN